MHAARAGSSPSACSEPRSRRLSVRAAAKDLDVYLALRGPAGRTVAVFDGKSYMGGIVARGGTQPGAAGRVATIVSRMLVYGEDEAADELERLVEGWVEQGRPGRGSMSS